MSGVPEQSSAEAVDRLHEAMAADGLQPLWTITADLLPPHPRPQTLPWLWSGRRLREHALDAVRLVPIGRGGERRAISLVNPGLGGRPYATSTLWGALQALGPRESAPAHRHSPGAIRFVLEGEGVWTTVDGDPCDMTPGDLVLTPSWAWHDHNNPGDGPMLWFDGLDLPIVEALDAVFFETFAELTQPTAGGRNQSEFLRGPDALVVGRTDVRGDGRSSPLLVYRWVDTDSALTRLAETAIEPMVTVEFANPATGSSALPTASCAMHRLSPGEATAPWRVTGSSIFVVYAGKGRSTVGDRTFEWQEGDMFACPSWAPISHRADERSDLFSFSDRPVLQALGLWREEAAADPEAVTTEGLEDR